MSFWKKLFRRKEAARTQSAAVTPNSSGQTISTRSEIAQRLQVVAPRCGDFTPIIAGIAEAIETGVDPMGKVAPSREEVAALAGLAEMLEKEGKQSEAIELVYIAKAVQDLIKQ